MPALMVALCSCDAPVADEPLTDYEAALSDFDGYRSWTPTTAPRVGPDPANRLGIGSHGWTDSALVRSMWVKQPGAVVDNLGNYPIGTIFLKELVRDGRVESIVAMVKRAWDFSPKGRGWEFFVIENGAIVARGDTIMKSSCHHCHGHAPFGKDMVFTR